MSQDLKKLDSSSGKAGFTLIELLVTIAVIGILSTIGIVQMNQSREKARDAQRKSDLAGIRSSLTLYYDDNDFTYPTTYLDTGAEDPNNLPDGSDEAEGVFSTDPAVNVLVPEYLSSLPEQPSSDTEFQYWYDANSDQSAFLLYAHLEGMDTHWYWIDDRGNNGLEDSTTEHDIDNCDAGGCTW